MRCTLSCEINSIVGGDHRHCKCSCHKRSVETQVTKGKNSLTYFEDIPAAVCNDCGAMAESVDAVVHFDSCKPGESDAWASQNNSRDLEEEARLDEEYRKYLYGEL